MIKLTRLDGQPFILNADLIRYVEQRPDTFVTLVSGERIVVNESMQQVVELAIEYQQRKAMLPSLMRRPTESTSHAGGAVCKASGAKTFPGNVMVAE
jgi:flagellar protein FlbD